MVSIEFHLRPSRRGGDSKGSMLVRVIARRKCASLTLPYRLYPTEWDRALRKVLLGGAEKERDKYLCEVSTWLEKDRRLLKRIEREEREKGPVDTRKIISVFKMRRFQSGLKEMAGILSDELKEKGRDRTARAYRSALNALLHYSGTEDISPAVLTAGLAGTFRRFFKKKRKEFKYDIFLYA